MERFQGKRFRVWLDNADTSGPLDLLKSKVKDDIKYMITGYQDNTNAGVDKHLEGFIIFKETKRLSLVKKLIRDADWEVAQAKSSCIMEEIRELDDVEETGVVPSTAAKRALENSRFYWTDVVRACKDGTVKDEYPKEYFMYNDACEKLK